MTDLDLRAGQIHRGLGVVARWPDIALVIPSDAAHDATVDQMFHDLGPEPEAPQIVAAINELLAREQLRSVAMIVEATGGPMAMAFGPVEVLVDGELVLDGSNGGVRQQVPSTSNRLILRAARLTKAAEPVAPYDLRRGVAPGAGLTLLTIGAIGPAMLEGEVPAPPAPPAPPSSPEPVVGSDAPAAAPPMPPEPEPAPEPTPAPDEQEEPEAPAAAEAEEPTALPPPSEEADPAPVAESAPAGVRSGRFPDNDEPEVAAVERQAPAVEPNPMQVPFRSVVLVGTTAEAPSVPLPLAGDGTGVSNPDDIEAGRVEVQGVLCTRNHFNNPEAAYCMVCGLPLAHVKDNLVTGLRPTLGFIVFDDGSTYGLDRSYVIGREPRPPDGSSAQLLVLRDNNETLSRTHAILRLDDWSVQLVDLGSTNGTYVWDQGEERWNQLTPNNAVSLRSGDTVALGRRTFVFESVSRG